MTEQISENSAPLHEKDEVHEIDPYLNNLNRVRFEQVPGEELTGIVLGEIDGPDGGKLLEVALTKQSREKAGMNVMRVPVDFIKQPERVSELQQETIEDLGTEALDLIPLQNPAEAAVEARDTFGDAAMYSPDEIRGMREAASRVVDAQPVAIEQTPDVPETELQVAERQYRVTRSELDDLYARHRMAAQGSDEQRYLESDIKDTKEKLGAYAKTVAKLKGSNWS